MADTSHTTAAAEAAAGAAAATRAAAGRREEVLRWAGSRLESQSQGEDINDLLRELRAALVRINRSNPALLIHDTAFRQALLRIFTQRRARKGLKLPEAFRARQDESLRTMLAIFYEIISYSERRHIQSSEPGHVGLLESAMGCMYLVVINPEYFRRAVLAIRRSPKYDAVCVLRMPLACFDVFRAMRQYCWAHTATEGFQLPDIRLQDTVPFTVEAAWEFVAKPYRIAVPPAAAATEDLAASAAAEPVGTQIQSQLTAQTAATPAESNHFLQPITISRPHKRRHGRVHKSKVYQQKPDQQQESSGQSPADSLSADDLAAALDASIVTSDTDTPQQEAAAEPALLPTVVHVPPVEDDNSAAEGDADAELFDTDMAASFAQDGPLSPSPLLPTARLDSEEEEEEEEEEEQVRQSAEPAVVETTVELATIVPAAPSATVEQAISVAEPATTVEAAAKSDVAGAQQPEPEAEPTASASVEQPLAPETESESTATETAAPATSDVAAAPATSDVAAAPQTSINPSLLGTGPIGGEAADDTPVETEEVWENQRWMPGFKFSKGHLRPYERRPYSTRDGRTRPALDKIKVPAGWEWLDEEWAVDLDLQPSDSAGWQYAMSWGGTYYDKAKYFCVVRRRKWVRQRAFTRAIVASVGNAVPKPAPTIASKVLSTFTGAGSSVVTALQTVGQGLVGLVAPAEEPRRGSTEGPEQLYKPHVDHELLVFRLSRDFDAAGDDVDTIAPPPHTTDHHEAEDMDFEFYDPDNAVADWFRSRYCALPQSIGLRPAQEAIEDVDMLRSILEQQEHRCMSCRAQLVSVEDDPLATHNRLCFFSGNIYCADCHAGYVAVVPMRAMTMMDFSPAPVSDKAEHMLSLYMREPMLSKALFENPPFVDMEKEPAEIAQLRRDFLKKIDDFEELRLKLVVKYENAVKQAGSKPFRWRNSHLEYFFYRNPQLLSRTNMSSMTMEIALSLMTEMVGGKGVSLDEEVTATVQQALKRL